MRKEIRRQAKKARRYKDGGTEVVVTVTPFKGKKTLLYNNKDYRKYKILDEKRLNRNYTKL